MTKTTCKKNKGRIVAIKQQYIDEKFENGLEHLKKEKLKMKQYQYEQNFSRDT